MDPRFSELRVLLVADDGDLLDQLRGAMTGSYQLTACRSPRNALALLDCGKRFDILVSGFHLLELGGPELHRRVVETDPVLAHNCLFVVSGRLTPEEERFLDEGRCRLLYTPFRVERLRDEVRALAARAALAMSA